MVAQELLFKNLYVSHGIFALLEQHDLSAFSFSRGTSKNFGLKAIRRRNRSFEIVKEAANAWSAKSGASMVMWRQSGRHGLFGTSGTPTSILPRSSDVTQSGAASEGCSKRDVEYEVFRIFPYEVAPGLVENYLEKYSRLPFFVKVFQQGRLDLLITDRQQSQRSVAHDSGTLRDQS